MPRYRLHVIPAALTGIAVFIKFNMTMALTATLIAYSFIAWINDHRRVFIPATILVTFLSVVGVTGIGEFSSPSGFVAWLDGSLQLSASNSEAMSIPAPVAEVILATAIAGIMLLLFGELRRRGTGRESVLWGVLGGILSFFSFKHGFVRGDVHIYYFFLFMPALAASSLLLP